MIIKKIKYINFIKNNHLFFELFIYRNTSYFLTYNILLSVLVNLMILKNRFK